MIRFIFCLLSLLYLAAGCQRELHFDDSREPVGALYQFVQSGDSCSTPLLSGSFVAGTALNDSAAVVLQVNVTRPGTYDIRTATNNGLYFRDSGSFSSTGRQSITLRGRGSPEQAGNFWFTGAGCGFAVQVRAAEGSPAQFSLGGSPGSCTGFRVTGLFNAGSPADSRTQGINITVTVIRTGTYQLSTPVVNGLQFSASGRFSSTGTQTLWLGAQGTPLETGSYTYSLTNGNNRCSFSISVDPAGPPAQTQINCADIIVTGSYQRGTALSSANSLVIPVQVSAAGYYSLRTSYTNGCVFSGSGFLPLGDQVMVLSGTGIPPEAGNFMIPLKLGADSCAVAISFSDGSFSDYFVCSIDGVEQRFEAELKADDAGLFPNMNSISIVGKPAPGSDEYLSITLNAVQPISPGIFNQGASGQFSTSFHKTAGNVFWTPNDQSVPRFSVQLNFISATRAEGVFQGQYFDGNGSGTRYQQISNGRFSVRIQ